MKKGSQFSAVSASPWLMYTHGDGEESKFQTVCSVNPFEKPYVENIDCLSGKYIVGSSRGWLFLRTHNNNKMIHLWNPDTSNLIILPPITSPKFTENTSIWACVLTNNPNNNNNNDAPSIVLLFCYSVAFSYRLSRHDEQTEANDWISQDLELNGVGAIVMTHAVIDETNRVIYGLCYAKSDDDDDNINPSNLEYLVRVNVDDENNIVTLGPMQVVLPAHPNRRYFPFYCSSNSYVIEICGIVYVVLLFWINKYDKYDSDKLRYQRITGVKVWMLDLETLTWVEAHSLHHRAFFISNNTDAWSWANNEAGVEPNSIYLYSYIDNTVYHYKFHDHSVTPLPTCPHLLHPWDPPCWIVLSHHHQRSCAGHISSSDAAVVPLDSEKPFDHHKTTDDDVISSLPGDLIQYISKRLYLFDYLTFRRVCKSVQSQLPLCRRLLIDHRLLPLFLFSKNKADGLCQIMDPTRTDSCFITIPFPSKFERFFDFSNNGWLLFGMRGPSLNYFNLSTGVTGSYPACEHMNRFTSLGFSTSPASSNCLTVAISARKGAVNVFYHRYGENEWNIQHFMDDDFKFHSWPCSSVIFVDGAFYFLDASGHVGVFKLEEDEEPHMMFYDKPKLETEYFVSNHLVECDGQILSVFIGEMGKWVQVFKFDKLNKVWVEVKQLGDNILFINHTSSMSAVAPQAGMGNRIYLPRLYKGGIVYYSLETCKFHTCATNHSLHDLCGTSEQLRCSWV